MRHRLFQFALLTGAAILACNSDPSISTADDIVEVRLVPALLTLDVGQVDTAQAFPLDADEALVTNVTPEWSSVDPAVATVDDSGRVTATGIGETWVRATAGEIAGSLFVAVTPPEIQTEIDSVHFAAIDGTVIAPVSVRITSRRVAPLTGVAVGGVEYLQGNAGWLETEVYQSAGETYVKLTVAGQGLQSGSYRARVQITATNPGTPPELLDVDLSLVPPPTILLTPMRLDLTAMPGGTSPATQTVQVTNIGSGTLTSVATGTPSYTEGGTNWLTASVNTTTAPATLTIVPSTGALAVGRHSASVPITSTTASNNTQYVKVIVIIAAGPVITLTPASINLAITPGTSYAAVTTEITNSAAGTLGNLAVGTPVYTEGTAGWVTSATLNRTTAPATLTIQPATAPLAAGRHVVQIPITSDQASNSPQSVQVAVNVTTGPVMQLSTNLVEVSQPSGGVPPANVTVTITNVGGGSLGFIDGGVTEWDGPFRWINAGIGSGQVVISLDRTNELPAGLYTARIAVNPANGTGQAIVVKLTIS